MQTERLDHAMGRAWVHLPHPAGAARYVACWRRGRAEREQQPPALMKLGWETSPTSRACPALHDAAHDAQTRQAAGLGGACSIFWKRGLPLWRDGAHAVRWSIF